MSYMISNRVLFVAPPTHETQQLLPDLGIGFIASALRENLYSVDFIDMERDGVEVEELIRRVREKSYFMVGIKVFSFGIPESAEVIKAVREAAPSTRIIIGGPHATYAYEDAMKTFSEVDVAIIGEGEQAVVELAKAFEKGQGLERIESIYYRQNGQLKLNPRKTFLDLSQIPIPAWDLMDPRLYRNYENLWFFSKGDTIANISISRGCPFKCTFCSDFISSGRKVRYRKTDDVIEEIKRLQGYYGVDEIHLTDSIFTNNKRNAYEFCESLIRQNIKIHWATPYGTRLDTLDAGLLRAMDESGCYGTSVGIESGSTKILKFMKKGITREKIEEKLQLIKSTTNFLVQGFFILGYPTETKETIQETIDFACRLPLDIAAFAPFRVTPGTEIAGYLEENEPESNPDWSNQTIERVIYTPRGITPAELKKLHRKAYRDFYLRPHIIRKLMKMIKGKKQIILLADKLKRRLFRSF